MWKFLHLNRLYLEEYYVQKSITIHRIETFLVVYGISWSRASVSRSGMFYSNKVLRIYKWN